jgi:hypothetical protein
MREIPLTKGYYTIVDDEDYDLLSRHKWCVLILKHKMYAWRTTNYRTVYMHTILTGYKETDHINGNGLDNRRENLRPTDHILNQGNIKSWSNNTSGFRGVTLERRTGKWVAQLNTKAKHLHLGTFVTKEEAARAYDKAALEYFGEFAYLNFPREEEAPSTE